MQVHFSSIDKINITITNFKPVFSQCMAFWENTSVQGIKLIPQAAVLETVNWSDFQTTPLHSGLLNSKLMFD